MENYLVQTQTNLPGIINGLGPFGTPGSGAPSIVANIITMIIGILTTIAGIYFFFILIAGAISWIGAGGDKGAIEDARKRITMGLLGIAVVVAAIFIVQIVGDLLGLPRILDPATLIPSLAPTP